MKYRVKTDFLKGYNKGEKIQAVDMNGKGFPCLRDNIKGIDERIIERNPDWFEKVEQVQEGEYRKWYGDQTPFRVMKMEGDSVYWKYINAEKRHCGSNGFMLEHSSKLSTDEIEQALIKEAKRRGFHKAKKWKPAYNTSVEFWTPCDNCTGFEYDVDVDELYYANTCIYARGNWAEIIDEDRIPNIEINGYKAEFHDYYVQFGCEKVSKSTILEAHKLHNSFHIMIMDEKGNKITKELKQIAEYYENV